MEAPWYLWLGLIIFFSLGLLLVCIPFMDHRPTSEYELDMAGCEQMRASGMAEQEIEEFMDKCGGYYHPPKPEKVQ